ncbi:hypothetical protein C0995_008084 [Termitomyces sp. Mi166|nr:hypothetical protein C0995_008084 [Termitomyces sp. Mi166\
MLNFMDSVTDKPDWHEKVFDDKITSKWKEEALANKDVDISEKMVGWCIDELRYKTIGFKKTGAVSVYNGDVVKSDTVISDELKQALRAAATPLEQVPERAKDWHPQSNNKVLDLVHPSLFPLIYGRTRILPNSAVGLEDCIKRSGEGVTVPVPREEEDDSATKSQNFHHFGIRPISSPHYSKQFQWLPCDVDISDPARAKIKSYINNLHPGEHKSLYSVIEEIITQAIPLWNMSLSPLGDDRFRYDRISYSSCEYDPDPENIPETEGPQQEESEDEDEYLERREEWIRDTCVIIQPEPGDFAAPAFNEHLVGKKRDKMIAATVDLQRDFADRGLQVIVKLANIHLTPEQPTYEGGTWHVEGQLVSFVPHLHTTITEPAGQNEHICASAIYYYDSENITRSQLSFRQQSSTDTDVGYEQGHHDWLVEVFGCYNHDSAIQDSGTVNTPEGRLITWPNVLQHQVQPFELQDRTKPGHRKILALFLVDPHIRVISTANVPCQQREWWGTEVRQENTPILKLPAEVQDHIIGDVEEFPISLDEAKELRLKLMSERRIFVRYLDDALRRDQFSLCEH